MNKTVLITIGVIVGLLALWLLVILFYPKKEETTVNQNVQPTVNQTNQLEAVGGSSGTVTATVTIVESLDDLNSTTGNTNAEVTID